MFWNGIHGPQMLNHTLVHEGNHSRTLPSSPQEKLGHSRSMCFQINCWYCRPMLKYHEIALNSCISLQRRNVVKALFDLIWPSALYVHIPLISKFCLVNSGWRRDVELNHTNTSSYGIIVYYKLYYTVLYKLPRFYNAYGTGGSTMIFFHSRTLRVYPQGGAF